MRTLGIDLAAQPAGTAAAIVEWDGEAPELLTLERGLDDDALVALCGGIAKIGIDAPLGWPEPFRKALGRHVEGRGWPRAGADPTASRRELRFRRTDLEVHERTGVWPLPVAASWIADVAFRAAALCTRLEREADLRIDRSGIRGRLCEVYPAGLLAVWEAHPGSYARGAAEREKRRRSILAAVGRETGLALALAQRKELIGTPDSHQLDAVLCALLAGMAQRGDTVVPAKGRPRKIARREGWIHLPPAPGGS